MNIVDTSTPARPIRRAASVFCAAAVAAGLTFGLTGSAGADNGPVPPACATVDECRAGLGYWYDVATTYEWSMDVAAGREDSLRVERDEALAALEACEAGGPELPDPTSEDVDVDGASPGVQAKIERQAARIERQRERIERLRERLGLR